MRLRRDQTRSSLLVEGIFYGLYLPADTVEEEHHPINQVISCQETPPLFSRAQILRSPDFDQNGSPHLGSLGGIAPQARKFLRF